MTGFLLDTDIVSEVMNPAPNPRVTAFLREQRDRRLWLSVVALYELEYGMRLLPEGRRRRQIRTMVAEIVTSYSDRIRPVGRDEAQRAAWLRGRAPHRQPGAADRRRADCRDGGRAGPHRGHPERRPLRTLRHRGREPMERPGVMKVTGGDRGAELRDGVPVFRYAARRCQG